MEIGGMGCHRHMVPSYPHFWYPVQDSEGCLNINILNNKAQSHSSSYILGMHILSAAQAPTIPGISMSLTMVPLPSS